MNKNETNVDASKEKKHLKRDQVSRYILNFIDTVIESRDLSNDKLLDFLQIFNAALHSNNSFEIVQYVVDLHRKIVTYYDFDEHMNNQFFENLIFMFKIANILEFRSEQYSPADFERKLMLMLEYYVMKGEESLSEEQFEFILEFIEYKLEEDVTFPLIFQFIKLVAMIQEKRIQNRDIRLLIDSISTLILDYENDHPDMERIKNTIRGFHL